MPKNVLPIGSFSEGTMKAEDIGDALVSILSPLRLKRDERATIREWERCREDESNLEEGETFDDLLYALYDIADNYAPDNCYVGAQEGDGACFGVWSADDSEASNEID